MSLSRIFFAIWSLLFLLFAYWQFNDPDPEVWVTIYIIAAIICALASLGKFYTPFLVAVAITAFVGGVYLFPSSVKDWVLQEWQQADLSMKTPDMEIARESFGLLIVSVIIGLAAFKGYKEQSKTGKISS